MLGFKRFETAAITVNGVEFVVKIRKQQFKIPRMPGGPGVVPGIWTAVIAA
jgi:hypothetical protein